MWIDGATRIHSFILIKHNKYGIDTYLGADYLLEDKSKLLLSKYIHSPGNTENRNAEQ